jgi:peptidyl-prolyl cis-trans isomerase SurA
MTESFRRCLLPALAALGIVLGWSWPAAQAQAQAGAPASIPVRTEVQVQGSRQLLSGDYIVAVVNTELVTAVEVDQRLERARAELRRRGGDAPTADALRQQVLDSLIDERVQITFAREGGQKVDDGELDRAVANLAAQNQISVPQLRERLKAEGMDYARFRNNLRDQILLERVREREVNARIRISDTDIDKVVDAQRGNEAPSAEMNLAQILVSVREDAAADVVEQRLARIEQALSRLRAGENFEDVAREYSEDSNRAKGGELGLRPVSRLPDLFVEAVRDLAVGQYTPQPLRSGAGFHLLKVLARQEGQAFKVTQTHARHILLRLADRADAPAASRRLEGLRRQIERGDRKFEDVAREVSEDGSAANGGDLGWAAPGAFVPEFEEAMNKLSPGGISPPVISRFGAHLIQVTERREVAVDPKEIREQARNQLREQKFEQAYLDWVRDLRLRAYIEMREPPQ